LGKNTKRRKDPKGKEKVNEGGPEEKKDPCLTGGGDRILPCDTVKDIWWDD
jgi:hypothetical protein